MGGGPASGKSVLVNSGVLGITPNRIEVNCDDIKEFLPEYAKARESMDPQLAARVHDESSHIAHELLDEAIAGKYHLILDATGNTSFDSVQRKVDNLRQSGHKVHAHYVTVPTELAKQRNKVRFAATGRMVPESYLESTHSNVSAIVPLALNAGLFDKLTLHDTSEGKAVPVMSAKGRDFKVHDEEKWNGFLDKAYRGTKAAAKLTQAEKAKTAGRMLG